MADKDLIWSRVFFGFGILTVISGVFLIYEQDYLIGFSGSAVGLMITSQNFNKIKSNDSD